MGSEQRTAFFHRYKVQESPSHTVGSELLEKGEVGKWTAVTIPHGGLGTGGQNIKALQEIVSPSHTVGSELAMREFDFEQAVKKSPSHTVGSERALLRW